MLAGWGWGKSTLKLISAEIEAQASAWVWLSLATVLFYLLLLHSSVLFGSFFIIYIIFDIGPLLVVLILPIQIYE